MTNGNTILQTSPLDGQNIDAQGLAAAPKAKKRWKPSQFNVQVTTEEGWLLLWNSYTGSMNSFRPAQRDAILDLISPAGISSEEKGIVSYLAGRGFIIPHETNELRTIQYEFGREHYRNDRLELILLASEDCNFRCTYCYEDFKRGTMRPDVRQGVKNLVKSRLDTLRELEIWWFGGEPLYGMRAIDDLAPFFHEVSVERGIKLTSNMTTNGYLLTKDVADRLLAWGVTDFQITVDGMPDDHDRHRSARDGSSTFQVIFDNLQAMSERTEEFSIVIRINFDRENSPGLERFLALVKETFKNDPRFTIAFHAVGKWGGPNDADLATCGVDEARETHAKLKAAAKMLGLKIVGDQGLVGGAGVEVCYAARPYNFIVGSSGDLMKCTIDLDMKDHNIVGKLGTDGTLDLNTDKMALWTEPAFERDTGCQSCHIMAACQGIHCPKIRIDSGERPCPSVRRTAKQKMVEQFERKQGEPILTAQTLRAKEDQNVNNGDKKQV